MKRWEWFVIQASFNVLHCWKWYPLALK